jgi:hypothetical protein
MRFEAGVAPQIAQTDDAGVNMFPQLSHFTGTIGSANEAAQTMICTCLALNNLSMSISINPVDSSVAFTNP